MEPAGDEDPAAHSTAGSRASQRAQEYRRNAIEMLGRMQHTSLPRLRDCYGRAAAKWIVMAETEERIARSAAAAQRRPALAGRGSRSGLAPAALPLPH